MDGEKCIRPGKNSRDRGTESDKKKRESLSFLVVCRRFLFANHR